MLQLERCPHCGSDAPVDRHADLRYKCRACGRPRIPFDARAPTPPAVAAKLKRAGAARTGKIAWKAGGWGFAALAACSALFTLAVGAIFDSGAVGYGVMGAITLVPVMLSLMAFRSSKSSGKKFELELEQAWSDAVAELYRRHNGQLDGAEVARSLGVGADYATQLLAEAEVQQILGSGSDEPLKLRVDPAGSTSLNQLGELEQLEAEAAERELLEALGENLDTESRAKR